MNLQRLVIPSLVALLGWSVGAFPGLAQDEQEKVAAAEAPPTIEVFYLEFVTAEVEATCELLAEQHEVSFGKPDETLGGARIAPLTGGGRLGVRAPMHAGEQPTVRVYRIVEGIAHQTSMAVEAGGTLMVPPMDVAGGGKFSIYEHGGLQHGLWQR